MLSTKLFYRFCGIVTIVALLSVSHYAQDKAVPTQYASYLNAVNAPYAWNLGYTGQNVVVGVIDDSIDMNHPFFSSNIDTDSAYNTGAIYNNAFFRQNFMSNLPTQNQNDTSAVWDRATVKYTNSSSNSVSEYDSHGTSVTGCIAAYDSDSHTYGPAYDATIVPIRVDFPCQAFPASYGGYSVGNYTFAQALVYENENIDIKNNSYGTSMGYIGQDAALTIAAINDAMANNTILLYSAGNERNKTNYSNNKDCSKRVTNAHPYTITVAATGKNYTTDYTGYAPFSNYGACVFITAPGVGIRTSDREDESTTGKNYSTDYTGYAPFSNYGACVFITAPGVGIRTSDREDESNTNNVFTYNCTLVSESSYQGSVTGNMNSSFNGTSASCPVASGVLALALDAYKQAYPDQTCDVRYIKQLLARTSTKIDVNATAEEVKWVTNNAGISFSHTYGFGQINAQGLIDAILDPIGTLGKNYDIVTEPTVAAFDWSTMTVSTEQFLQYTTTYPSAGNSGGSFYMTTFGISEEELLAAAAEYQSGSAAYVTPNDFELMAANEPVYTDTLTISDDSFLSSGILKQDMEEVVVTLTASATNTTTGFDPRYMQITLDHDGVTSYLAFADPNSAQYNVNSITWSFCSNAFWGEDPTGEWMLNVYNTGTEDTFTISDVFSTFYMGKL